MEGYDLKHAAEVMAEVAGIDADALFSRVRTERVFWAKVILSRYAMEKSCMSGRRLSAELGCSHATLQHRLRFYDFAMRNGWRFDKFMELDRKFSDGIEKMG